MPQYAPVIDLSTLNGANGFRVAGYTNFEDFSGWSVAGAGDLNGDGFADIVIGAPEADNVLNGMYGRAFVVFGEAGGWAASINVNTLDGSNGFRIPGLDASDRLGSSVAAAGDVNGDGIGDLIVGGPGPGSNSAYVIFGATSGWASDFDLATLDGTNGFRITGAAFADRGGSSVRSAGDVNGDGIDDLIVGADGADPGGDAAGSTYVIFGAESGWAATFNLASLDGSNGFRLDGIDNFDNTGTTVAAAGDVNGDGFADLIIGAPGGDPDGLDGAGETYVVFGAASGWSASLDLASLNGGNGFRLDGAAVQDVSGYSVASAGDVNADGIADLVIGAWGSAPGGDEAAGDTYVVFGAAAGWSASLDLSSLDGANGFRIAGVAQFDRSGWSVASAGDVNGDGFADILIGARTAGTVADAGATYVVFGAAGGWSASFDLAALDGNNGYRLEGIDVEDWSGYSVAGAGDVNGDGLDDIIVGAPHADGGPGFLDAGESYAQAKQ